MYYQCRRQNIWFSHKNKLKAVVCKNCKMVYLKQDEGKGK